MIRPMRSRLILLFIIGFPLFLYAGCYYAPGAAVVVQSSTITGWPRTIANWQFGKFTEREEPIPSRHGALRTRFYRPAGRFQRSIVLVPGVHALGIDEPRLVGFARNLAADGVAVVTPDVTDLNHYMVVPRATDMIEDAVAWTAKEPTLSPDGLVGMMGISFGGGLSVVAAGRPSIKEHVAFVLSFGGHGDFPRELRFLCLGILPDGSRSRPHDYGVVLIMINVVDRLVPPEQAERLRGGVRTFLNASHLDMFDKSRAAAEFRRAKDLETTLPEPSATLMRHVNTRNVAELGPRLMPHISWYGKDPSLSPERSSPPTAPVYLLHGAEDNVIPPMETVYLARYLEGRSKVRQLISPLITHAEIDHPAVLVDVWHLISFWSSLLAK